MLERAQESSDSDIQRFCRLLIDKESCSIDEKVMLLALMADPELEIRPYLDNLAGRQNVPWYLRRFAKDWRRFIAKCKEVSAGDPAQEFSWSELMSPERKNCSAEQSLTRSMKLVLGFRKTFFMVRENGRAEVLVKYLLLIVREFYSYYNHPETRGLSHLGSASIVKFSVLTSIIGELVEHSFNLLEFCCEKDRFVLHIEGG